MSREMEEASKIIEEAAADTQPAAASKQPKLSLIIGGKGGGSDAENPDWLSSLKINTVFLIQTKSGSEFVCGQYQILMKSPNGKAVFLYSGLVKEERLWVLPMRFCNMYKLVDVIFEGDDVRGNFGNAPAPTDEEVEEAAEEQEKPVE